MTYTAEDLARINATALRCDIRAVLDGYASEDVYDRIHKRLTGEPMRDPRAIGRIRDLLHETAMVAAREPVEA